jgi:small subunit ribosomal protein S17
MGTQTENTQDTRGSRKTLRGRVVTDTANPARPKKTVTVVVERRFRDPVYGKYVKSRKKYVAHDETEQFKTNDMVEITESRPLSRTKRWVVSKLVSRPEEV